jgi:DNA-directed RNA polymerase specialized sigma24 family protein
MSDTPINKRGRKRTTNLYFGPVQETAVVEFLSSTDEEERNKIFNTHLRAPLNKMIESIIRRYKLYRKEYTYEDIHSDTLSFLATKMEKFEPSKNKKAYSYFGTICKNYLLGQLLKADKRLKSDLSYEDMYSTVEKMDDYKYSIEDSEKTPLEEFIKEISTNIKIETQQGKLNENELRVGDALITVLDNWENIFEQVESGNKYNKNLILSYIRELSGLTTKDIRVSMRRYKKIYTELKGIKIDQGLL